MRSLLGPALRLLAAGALLLGAPGLPCYEAAAQTLAGAGRATSRAGPLSRGPTAAGASRQVPTLLAEPAAVRPEAFETASRLPAPLPAVTELEHGVDAAAPASASAAEEPVASGPDFRRIAEGARDAAGRTDDPSASKRAWDTFFEARSRVESSEVLPGGVAGSSASSLPPRLGPGPSRGAPPAARAAQAAPAALAAVAAPPPGEAMAHAVFSLPPDVGVLALAGLGLTVFALSIYRLLAPPTRRPAVAARRGAMFAAPNVPWAAPDRSHGPPPAFRPSLSGQALFRDAEFVRRNPGVGLYYSEDLSLAPWIPVGDAAAVGVDRRGRVFQVVDLGDRRLAYLLSGDVPMREVFLTETGHLFALDPEGGLHQFDWRRWETGGWRAVMTSTLLWFVAAQASLVALGVGAHWWLWDGVGSPYTELPLVAAAGAVGSVLAFAWMLLLRFERQNELTNGFEPLGRVLSEPWEADSRGGDVVLRTERGGARLVDLIAQAGWRPEAAADFGVQDKHRALPRGVHPSAYEPRFK